MFDELKEVNYLKKKKKKQVKEFCNVLLICFHKLRKTPLCKIVYISIVRTKQSDDLLIAPDNIQKKHLLL